MKENLKNLLLNKNTYCITYFLDNPSSLIEEIQDISVYKIGTSRRMTIKFTINNRFEYYLLKKELVKEKNFLNGSFEGKLYCANFITDKKNNATLDMLIALKSVNDISKDRILNLLKLF